MTRLPIVLALTAAFSVAGPSLCAQLAGTTGQPDRSQTQSPKIQRAGESAGELGISRGSQLIGLHVFDPSGAAIGEIKDLGIDSSGRVTAVLAREGGGFTGVPLTSLTPQLAPPAAQPGTTQTGAAQRAAGTSMGVGAQRSQTANVDRFVFSGDVNRLRSAPALQDAARLDEAWMRATAEHFGVGATGTTGTNGTATPQPGPAAAGRVATATAQQVRPALGFQSLMSRRLNTISGQRVGEFRDVAIDLRSGQAPFIVFGRPGTGTTGEVLHGAGFDAFSFNDPSTAFMDIDTGTLDRSPGLDIGQLPSQPSLRLEGRAPRATTPAGGSRPGTGERAPAPAPTTPRPSGGTTPR